MKHTNFHFNKKWGVKCGYLAFLSLILFCIPKYFSSYLLIIIILFLVPIVNFIVIVFRLTTVIVVDCSICFWYYLLSILLLSIEPKLRPRTLSCGTKKSYYSIIQGEPSKIKGYKIFAPKPIKLSNPKYWNSKICF